jgi:sulfoxide reductase heme-binding subunit YedZ
VTTVIDPDASVGLLSVIVPFTSDFSPFWVGLGAVALDLVVALMVTSLVRRRLSFALWRAIHWSAYAAWPLALAHGLGAGTDAATPWLRAVNASTIFVAGAAVVWRLAAAPAPAPARP